MMLNRRPVRGLLLRVIFIAAVGMVIGAVHAKDIGENLAPRPASGAQDGPQRVELSENAAPKSEAAEAWDAVKDTTNPALLEAFIKRYGATFFAEIAKARLDELKAAATKPSSPTAAKPSAPESPKAIRTYPIRRGQETPTDSFPQGTPPVPTDSFHPNTAPMPTEGTRQRAVLYDEDPSSPTGRQSVGSVIWRTEPTTVDGKPELAAHADVDIPSRGLRMTLSLRRNLDPSLPASHVVDLTFQVPPDFDGGGVASVPGILMKSNEKARGMPLAGLAVKVTGGVFLVGLSHATADRERNVQQLLERAWFDIPIVYANQRRAILAIDKGESGGEVFKTVFTAWDQYPVATQPAPAAPAGDDGGRR
jgi:hypothetical protein